MTTVRNDLIIRPITGPTELDLFCQMPYELNHELPDDLEQGRRRPDWMWVALRGDHLVARAAWWGDATDADAASTLDILDLDDAGDDREDRVDAGVRLLTAAMAAILPPGAHPPEYLRIRPAGLAASTRQSRQVVEDRMAAAARTGAKLFVERTPARVAAGHPRSQLQPDG